MSKSQEDLQNRGDGGISTQEIPSEDAENPKLDWLRKKLKQWKNADNYAEQEKIGATIRNFLQNNDNLQGWAYDHGWGDADFTLKKPGDKGKDGKGGGGKGGGGGKPNAPKTDGDLLPGELGKHYSVVRYNGKQYVVYKVKVPGSNRYMKAMWKVTDPDKHGIDADAGQQLTRGQFKELQMFGTADEIVRRNGGDKNPLKKFMEELRRRYGGTSYLKNKQVLGILVEGFLENADPGAIEDRIRQTDWYQKRTARQREWELGLSDRERDVQVDQMRGQMTNFLQTIFGPTMNWRKHFEGLDKNLANLAENIASGKWDDPSAAFADWQRRMQNKAEKIEGTAAWQARQKEVEEGRAFLNRPEDMFEQVRAQATEWLGYMGKPASGNRKNPERNTLWAWANQLTSGKKSIHDFQAWLRTKAQTLHPYLGPDEKWMDRASTYKSAAEEYLGEALAWDDKLLRDFVKRDDQGAPLKGGSVALTAWDFERAVKEDPRFRRSQGAVEEASAVADALGQLMSGAA